LPYFRYCWQPLYCYIYISQSAYRNVNKFLKAQTTVVFFLWISSFAILCYLLCKNDEVDAVHLTVITFDPRAAHAKIKIDFMRRSVCGGLHFRARNHYKIGVARMQVGIVICRSIAEWSLDQAFDPIPGGRYRFRIIRRRVSLIVAHQIRHCSAYEIKSDITKCFKQFRLRHKDDCVFYFNITENPNNMIMFIEI